MMDLDTVSNCSSISLRSEDTKSEISTLSGLSNYQDEFAELRHLVNPIRYPIDTFNRCCTPKLCKLEYEKSTHLSTLPKQLENSHKIQSDYKSDVYNLEKNLELKYYEKIEKLLKVNHRLQLDLESANEQIVRLLKNYSNHSIHSLGTESFIQLEQKYHDLTTKYSELQRDFFKFKTEREEYEIENKDLKIELSELKLGIETKKECLNEFKQKISQQYVEIETLLKLNVKYSENINELSSEVAHLKKTQDWYKERLHIYQNEKQVFSDEIVKYKEELCSQHDTIESLRVELSKWKTKCELTELNALKDKENMNKQLESIRLANDLKTDQPKINFTETRVNEESIVNYYENSIQDLTYEIVKIKEYVQEQDNFVAKLTKENSELMGRCITLQKGIEHNEIVIAELENVKKQLHESVDEIKYKLKNKSNELMIRENQILNIQTEMKTQKREQDFIEQTVKTLREQFSICKSKYKELKDQLSTKDKQILQLENEKQKLFMNNNWNICELEKLKEKDTIIKQLKDELIKNSETLHEYLKTIESMKNELNKNQEENLTLLNEKQSTIDKNHAEINKYEDALCQYKVMVVDYEKQIMDLQKRFEESSTKVTDLKDTIKILKYEINQKDININEINNNCIALENELKCKKIVTEDDTELVIKGNLSDEKKLHNKSYSNLHFQYTDYAKENRGTLENKIGKYVNTSNDLKYQKVMFGESSTNFKNQLKLKIKNIEDRIRKLHSISHQCHATLHNVFEIVNGNSDDDKVQQLNVLLQVKDLELKEKQKKYELNNRTLLRKVKEHMKGRNAAEKHNKYLQELYNALSEENNSLKLKIMSKESEVHNMKDILDKFTNVNEKLKSKLEEQIIKNSNCDKCISSLEQIELLENYIEDLKNEKLNSQNVLTNKEELVANLQKEIEQLLQVNASLSVCNKKLADEIKIVSHDKEIITNTIKKLENGIKKNETHRDELNALLEQGNEKLSETTLENNQLKNCADNLNTQIDFLSNEIKILNSSLQVKSEELNQLEEKKLQMETNWLKKQKDSQVVISTLKQYIHDMQQDIKSINTEKYFLQRLCNDLKLALKSHVNHNKVLQQQLSAISNEKDFNSLPNLLPNPPCDNKYDDVYINQLLKLNRAPLQGKSITEMKSCLDTLKKEVSTLQQQIAKKNIQY